MTTKVKNGNHMQTLQWTNDTGSDVAAGAIVKIGAVGQAMLAIALADIANGATGSVGYNCSVIAPKVSAAVFSQGEFLIWDASANAGAGAFDDNQATPASGDVSTNAARAEADGANLETTCTVWLTGIPGTLTA